MNRLTNLLVAAAAGSILPVGAAAAQDAIWVHCEPAGGQTYTLNYMGGTMQVGAGTWRIYNSSRQQLDENRCGDAMRSAWGQVVRLSCELTADEFTYEVNLGNRVFTAAIDRRTGRAFHREVAPNGDIDHQDYVCRGATDPRPAAQF